MLFSIFKNMTHYCLGLVLALFGFTDFCLYSVDKCVDRKTKPHYFERWENSLENVKYWHKQEWFLILEKL